MPLLLDPVANPAAVRIVHLAGVGTAGWVWSNRVGDPGVTPETNTLPGASFW
jgi:hypothetical protein